MNKNRNNLLFILLLIATFLASGSYEYLDLRPQGPHQWRQTDCTSFALNYAKDDTPLFEPAIHKLFSDNGTSGKTAGEFPLLYYFVGQVWQVTGQNELLYRVINLSIFCIGLFALFRSTSPYIKHPQLAYLLGILPLSMPVLAYYAPNFLQNSTALSMVFIAWYFVSKFAKKHNYVYAVLAVLLFALGGLLKITALISFLALLGTVGVDLLWKFRLKPVLRSRRRALFLVSASTVFILGSSVLWYQMAREYCETHGGWFTFNDLWPIWRSSPEYIWSTIKQLVGHWSTEFFTVAQYVLLLTSLVFLFIRRKDLLFFERWMLGFLAIGNTSYILLWFNAAHDHDYYFINLYALPIFLLFVTFRNFNAAEFLPLRYIRPSLWVVFATILSWSALSTRESLSARYTGWMNNNGHNKFEDFFDITHYLRNELKLDRKTPVIVYPDPSYSISLYLADQAGWPLGRESEVKDFEYSLNLHNPSYILVNDTTEFIKRGFDVKLPVERVDTYKKIGVYKVLQD